MKFNRYLTSVSIVASLVMVLFVVTSMVLLVSHISAQNNSSPNITSAATNASDLDSKMKQLESSNDPTDIATLAYIWGYPLVTAQVTESYFTNPNVPQGVGYGPANHFNPARNLINASFKEVVRPNTDTLYDQAWLVLTNGPLVLEVPDVVDRYYVLPFLDAYGNQFKYLGTRTTGEKGGTYVVVGPSWEGSLPTNLTDATMIHSPTNLVWIIGRILVKGPDDVQNVRDIQDKITLTPVMQNTTLRPGNGTTFPTADNIKKLGIPYFDILSNTLTDNPSPANQTNLVKKFETIGVGSGKIPSKDVTDQSIIEALNAGIMEGEKMIDEKIANLGTTVNGWSFNLKTGVYGEDYLLRAAVTKAGFGANAPVEAIYPAAFTDSDGKPLSGNSSYVIHFEPGQTPPVKGFWSITMYDNEGFFVDNAINRYNIGDNTVGLKNNTDGSLDVYIQHENPGKEKESNWLPAPNGAFNLLLRMYIPDESVLNGHYKFAPVVKVIGSE